jgi:hypothetical protein
LDKLAGALIGFFYGMQEGVWQLRDTEEITRGLLSRLSDSQCPIEFCSQLAKAWSEPDDVIGPTVYSSCARFFADRVSKDGFEPESTFEQICAMAFQELAEPEQKQLTKAQHAGAAVLGFRTSAPETAFTDDGSAAMRAIIAFLLAGSADQLLIRASRRGELGQRVALLSFALAGIATGATALPVELKGGLGSLRTAASNAVVAAIRQEGAEVSVLREKTDGGFPLSRMVVHGETILTVDHSKSTPFQVVREVALQGNWKPARDSTGCEFLLDSDEQPFTLRVGERHASPTLPERDALRFLVKAGSGRSVSRTLAIRCAEVCRRGNVGIHFERDGTSIAVWLYVDREAAGLTTRRVNEAIGVLRHALEEFSSST